MADIKTVTLVGDEEVRVDLGRKHVHIRNIGDEMIYASVKPNIVPFADGVLGIPSGAKDVLTNTDGYIYLKGTGTVQLVGSDYVNGVLSVMAGAGGTGNIDEAVALAVAKIVAGAPEDFDTLKEIADWISTHSDSAAAMNSDIQTLKTSKADKTETAAINTEVQSLKTSKADKTEIPTSLPANGGNAATVNNHTVEIDVPADAVFTDTTYSNATTSTPGLMSDTDKSKLDSAVQGIQIGGVSQTKTNGVVNIPAYPTSLPADGGNAATAAKLATARDIMVNLANNLSASFDGSSDVKPGVSGVLPITNGGTGSNTGYITAGKKNGTTVGYRTTAEGYNTTASGNYSHAEGYNTTVSGDNTHAEGDWTTASGNYSHAEGSRTTAIGQNSHTEGAWTTASGLSSHAEGGMVNIHINDNYESVYTTASGEGAHAEGLGTIASGKGAHAEGSAGKLYINDHYEIVPTTASGNYSHAEGCGTTASGNYSHAEGEATTASGNNTHAEGYITTASGYRSHAEGCGTTASAESTHAEGNYTTASGNYSHAEGIYTTASGEYSHAGGLTTTANTKTMTAIGQYNGYDSSATKNDLINLFVVGNGVSESALSNAFRVHSNGQVFGGTYNSTGADYAEYFEWLDSNMENEDRRGRFVTLYGNKIAFANSPDDFILGIVSGDPSVIGDAHDDQWNKMYLTDIFGSPIFEDVEVPEETDEEGNVIIPAHSEHRMKLNPEYDNNQKYIPRSERPEWSAVGMMGKLVVVDDGTCEVNGWCTPSIGGIGTKSETQTRYRVMERLDETHIRVLVI